MYLKRISKVTLTVISAFSFALALSNFASAAESLVKLRNFGRVIAPLSASLQKMRFTSPLRLNSTFKCGPTAPRRSFSSKANFSKTKNVEGTRSDNLDQSHEVGLSHKVRFYPDEYITPEGYVSPKVVELMKKRDELKKKAGGFGKFWNGVHARPAKSLVEKFQKETGLVPTEQDLLKGKFDEDTIKSSIRRAVELKVVEEVSVRRGDSVVKGYRLCQPQPTGWLHEVLNSKEL